jgi:hypothetical protein
MVNSVVDGALPSSQEQAPAVFNGANPLAENTVPIFKNLESLQRELAGLFGPGSESKVSYPASNSMSLNPLVTAAVMGDALKLVGGGEFSSTTPTAGVPKLLSAGNLLNMVTGEQTPSPTGRTSNPVVSAISAGDKLAKELRDANIRGAIETAEAKLARLTTERNKRDQELADQAGTTAIESKMSTASSDIATLKAQLA